MNKDLTRSSKFLSLILRHKPEEVGLVLDSNGWANVIELVKKSGISLDVLENIVATDEKQRYSFNENKTKIRANQGHSLKVNLNLAPQIPPDILYHGTAYKFYDSIKKSGLQKQSRQYVHLSLDKETALKVGRRHGNPVILEVDSKQMSNDGFIFYLSDNKVWLTDNVPYKYMKSNS